MGLKEGEFITGDKEDRVHQRYRRRDFFKTTAALLGGVGALGACRQDSEQSELPNKEASEGLVINATGYKHLEALVDARASFPNHERRGEPNHFHPGHHVLDLDEYSRFVRQRNVELDQLDRGRLHCAACMGWGAITLL